MKKKSLIFRITAVIILIVAVFTSCDESTSIYSETFETPVITDFYPKTGSIGDQITIKGENLEKVDSVAFGGGKTTILYRVNSTEMIVKVAATSRSGNIVVQYSANNVVYRGESAETFTVQYAKPALTNYPTTARASDQVLIEGNKLDAAISIFFGSAEGKIIYQSEKEMLVEVPFVVEDGGVDILLTYNDQNGVEKTGTTNQPFVLEKPVPSVTYCPSTAFVGSSITLTGTNLTQVDTVMIGVYRALITSKTDNELVAVVPGEYTQTSTVPLKIIYHVNKSQLLTDSFVVDASNVSKIYFWEARTIYANDESTPNNFFNAVTGDIFTPCEYAANKDNVYLLMSITGGAMRISNPNNSSNVTKGFKCSGVALPDEKMPRNIRLRRLLESNMAELALINEVKANSLDSISAQKLTDLGIDLQVSNSGYCDYKGGAAGDTKTLYEVGSVILMMEKGLNAANDAPTVKVGLIYITGISTTNPVSDKKSSITFNCYYEK